MLVKIEARILIFLGTGFHFPSTSVPPGTFLGSVSNGLQTTTRARLDDVKRSPVMNSLKMVKQDQVKSAHI